MKKRGEKYTAAERKATKEAYLAALVQYFGIASAAQSAVEIGDDTIMKWRREDPEFDAAVKAARNRGEDRLLDSAENGLAQRIESGDLKAIKYYLATKGRKRGYDTHQTIDVNEVHRPNVAFEEDGEDAL